MFLLLLFCGERRNHALALDLDLLREAGVALLDEAGGEPDLEQRNGETGGKVVELGALPGELHRLARFVAELLQRLGGFLVEEGFHGHTCRSTREFTALAGLLERYSNRSHAVHCP